MEGRAVDLFGMRVEQRADFVVVERLRELLRSAELRKLQGVRRALKNLPPQEPDAVKGDIEGRPGVALGESVSKPENHLLIGDLGRAALVVASQERDRADVGLDRARGVPAKGEFGDHGAPKGRAMREGG